MSGIIRLALPAAGILILVFTRKRWMKNLVAPVNLGSWLSTSCWAVFPAALFFTGFAVEKGRMYSNQGLVVVLIILMGIWGITGFPTLFLGVLKSIRSSKIRESYARTRGLDYHRERIESDLLPKSFSGFTNPILSNVLTVKPGILIACALKENRERRGTTMRGRDIALIDGVRVRGTLSAVRRKKRDGIQNRGGERPEGLKGLFHDRTLEIGEDQYLVFTPEKQLKDFLEQPDAAKKAVFDAKEMAQSCLQLVTQQGAGSREIRALYIHDGRVVLELDCFLDSEEKLDSCVQCAKRIHEWCPPASTISSGFRK